MFNNEVCKTKKTHQKQQKIQTIMISHVFFLLSCKKNSNSRDVKKTRQKFYVILYLMRAAISQNLFEIVSKNITKILNIKSNTFLWFKNF